MIEIKFEGIDSWYRPIFVSKKGSRYGSIDILISGSTSKQEIENITEEDLVYFGNEFDCEPMEGYIPGLKIVKEWSNN